MSTGDLALESLTRVIESIQDAIKRDGRTIGANETRTRNTLIDPVLRALGWADASVVTQEYLVRYGPREFDYGIVDYALHRPGERANPTLFLEAKRMSEKLTDDHRNQVFTYALDKGGELRQFGLTNGDQWELYKLFGREPLMIFKFSIRKDAVAYCANQLVRNFPMLNKSGIESDLRPADDLPTTVQGLASISPTPDMHVTPSRQLTRPVDVHKILIWLGFFLILFGFSGWAFGVWNAKPIKGFFEFAGLFGIGIIMLLAIVLIRRFSPSTVPVFVNVLRLHWLFAPIKGNRQKTLIGVGLATICGVGGGGVGGYVIGLQTGQAVVNALETLGQIVVTLAAIMVLLGLVYSSSKRRGGGWRPRSYSRKRRW